MNRNEPRSAIRHSRMALAWRTPNVQAEPGGRNTLWTSGEPGIAWQALADVARAGRHAPARLVQMRRSPAG